MNGSWLVEPFIWFVGICVLVQRMFVVNSLILIIKVMLIPPLTLNSLPSTTSNNKTHTLSYRRVDVT